MLGSGGGRKSSRVLVLLTRAWLKLYRTVAGELHGALVGFNISNLLFVFLSDRYASLLGKFKFRREMFSHIRYGIWINIWLILWLKYHTNKLKICATEMTKYQYFIEKILTFNTLIYSNISTIRITSSAMVCHSSMAILILYAVLL